MWAALLAMAVFIPAVFTGFVFTDDYANIGMSVDAVARGWWPHLLERLYGNFYRPGYAIAFAAGHVIWGLRAWAYHLSALAFHGLVVWQVARLTERLTGDGRTALVAGLLFGVGAQAYQCVVWISNWPLVGAAALALAGLALMIGWAVRGGPWRFGGGMAGFAAGLLTYPFGVPLALAAPMVARAAGAPWRRALAAGAALGIAALPWFTADILWAALGPDHYPAQLAARHHGADLWARVLRNEAIFFSDAFIPFGSSGLVGGSPGDVAWGTVIGRLAVLALSGVMLVRRAWHGDWTERAFAAVSVACALPYATRVIVDGRHFYVFLAGWAPFVACQVVRLWRVSFAGRTAAGAILAGLLTLGVWNNLRWGGKFRAAGAVTADVLARAVARHAAGDRPVRLDGVPRSAGGEPGVIVHSSAGHIGVALRLVTGDRSAGVVVNGERWP